MPATDIEQNETGSNEHTDSGVFQLSEIEDMDKTAADPPVCYLVIPCMNEQEVLPETSNRLLAIMRDLQEAGRIHAKSRILFVDDGSTDSTWQIISDLHRQDQSFAGLKLSRNRGHQNALFAGLMLAARHCDISISLDADLQDDPNVITDFIDRYTQGCEVVFGVRQSRASDTAFKRGTAGLFYSLMRLLGADIVPDHADYRLLGRKALAALSQYGEYNLFLRGLVVDLGFTTGMVYYTRNERFAGESKYPLRKMVSFAIDGITSFSNKPLRLMLYLGLCIALVSVAGLVYALVQYFRGLTISGWTTTVLSIWFLGGIQVMCIGVIGEYIGKVYSEAKGRPKYIIEEELLR